MSRSLRHRGPDDEGFLLADRQGVTWWAGDDTPEAVLRSGLKHLPMARVEAAPRANCGGLALGHRRLSIVDLSARGHQPMCYRDRYWLSYNGEVYNYPELRAELADRGHVFSSETDSEVILAAYAEWGPACLPRFNGMWGLAIYDVVAQSLFVARDRFGIKPVYFWPAGDRLAFASEIKAFAGLAGWRPRCNHARLLDFLIWNLSDHTPETMFAGVVQLPAGHYVQIDLAVVLAGRDDPSLNSIRPVRWYSLPTLRAGPAEAVAELRTTLEDAVRLRLRADVTVGSCLSGGLDSSAIVCLMSGLLRREGVHPRIATFTAVSEQPEFDERVYAETVVERAGVTSHQTMPRPERLLDEFPRIIWHQDEPFVSASIFAQWCVFEQARNSGVTVMLDGQGADEILGGYRGFFGARLAGLARRGRLLDWWQTAGKMKETSGFAMGKSAGYTLAYAFPGLVGTLGRLQRRAYSDRDWIRARWHPAFRNDPVARLGGRAADVRKMSMAQVTATNLPMLLRWEDRNSMAYSIEARVPFLDFRVVELCLRIADEDKLAGGISKAVLRHAMRGCVPDLVLDRRDKMGFVTAEPSWMSGKLAPRFRAELQEALQALDGLVDPRILGQFDAMVARRRPFDHRYFRVMAAGRWVRCFGVD